MLNLNFPQYTFKFREGEISLEIFCLSRRRWVPLTPEEWVRQHAIAFLHNHGRFPIALISAEYVWSSMGGRGRSDIVVFNNNAKVLGIVECKAPSVQLQPTNSQQLMAYQHFANPQWVILSNGLQHLVWDVEQQKLMEDWPSAGK